MSRQPSCRTTEAHQGVWTKSCKLSPTRPTHTSTALVQITKAGRVLYGGRLPQPLAVSIGSPNSDVGYLKSGAEAGAGATTDGISSQLNPVVASYFCARSFSARRTRAFRMTCSAFDQNRNGIVLIGRRASKLLIC